MVIYAARNLTNVLLDFLDANTCTYSLTATVINSKYFTIECGNPYSLWKRRLPHEQLSLPFPDVSTSEMGSEREMLRVISDILLSVFLSAFPLLFYLIIYNLKAIV